MFSHIGLKILVGQCTDNAENERVGEVPVKSELGNVAAHTERSHSLLQVRQNPVADADVDENERNTG